MGILSIKPTPIQEPSVNPSQVIYDYILCFTHCFVKSLQDKEEYNEVWIENTEFEEVNQCKNNGKGKKSGEEGSDSWIWKEGYWAITPKKGNQE